MGCKEIMKPLHFSMNVLSIRKPVHFVSAGFILVVLVVWALFKGSLNDRYKPDFYLDVMYFVEALSFVMELAGVVILMLGYCCSRGGASEDTRPIVT